MGRDSKIDSARQARTVLVVTLILNTAVAFAKILYGIHTAALSITSDGFHSLFDGVSNVIGLIGLWIASHPPDERHPYGHKKFETLFTIAISFMIFMTCVQILKKVFSSFQNPPGTTVTAASFIIMICTMLINILVASYETRKGKELKSDFLLADAMHTKSDILASCAVIVSLIFVRNGFPVADTAAGLIITFFIAKMGYEILKKATDALVDTAFIDTATIESVVGSVSDVRRCADIRTRGGENEIYLDMTVFVRPDMSIQEAHDIVDRIEELVKKEIPSIVDVVVHIEPDTC